MGEIATLHPMKHLHLLIFAALLTTSAVAQQQPQQQSISLAGEHLEKSAKARTTSLLTTAGGILLTSLAMTMEEDQRTPMMALGSITFAAGIGFNISSIGHERKAGKHLKGK